MLFDDSVSRLVEAIGQAFAREGGERAGDAG
jgi:hypothetical protein